MRFTLLHRYNGIRPLYKYLVAAREGMDDIRQLLLPWAAKEYRKKPHYYDRGWGLLENEELRNELIQHGAEPGEQPIPEIPGA